MSEKSEKATPKKLQDARTKGQVSQSQDVPRLVVCAGLIEVILMLDDSGMQKLQGLFLLPLSRLNVPFSQALNEVAGSAILLLASFCGLTCAIVIVLRVLSGWIQYGPLFAPEALKIDMARLNPMGQIKEMFSVKKLTDLFNSLLKAVAILLVLYLVLTPELQPLTQLANGDLARFWLAVEALLTKVANPTLAMLLVLTLVDFAIQKYFFLKKQRMSHQDIKDEHKQSEGDPHMKGHRRAIARELAEKPASAPVARPSVAEADVLLVNPTHYAVALFYRPESTPLPRIISKGEDAIAREMIAEAHTCGIPVIRFIWLTRTLWADNGQYIPRHTLQAVAQVYRVLRQLEHQWEENSIYEMESE